MSEPNPDDIKAANGRARGIVHSGSFIVPLLLKFFPDTHAVLDVGCGSASWLSLLQRHGVDEVVGIDRERDPRLHIDATNFRELDPAKPFKLDRRFDLTLCINAGEHVPAERAKGLVADLCVTSDVVVFCAAIPGESGAPHERWPSYWSRLFAARGYDCVDCLRPLIWEDNRIDYRFAQSLMCFIKADRLGQLAGLVDAKTLPPELRDVVHPLAVGDYEVSEEASK